MITQIINISSWNWFWIFSIAEKDIQLRVSSFPICVCFRLKNLTTCLQQRKQIQVLPFTSDLAINFFAWLGVERFNEFSAPPALPFPLASSFHRSLYGRLVGKRSSFSIIIQLPPCSVPKCMSVCVYVCLCVWLKSDARFYISLGRKMLNKKGSSLINLSNSRSIDPEQLPFMSSLDGSFRVVTHRRHIAGKNQNQSWTLQWKNLVIHRFQGSSFDFGSGCIRKGVHSAVYGLEPEHLNLFIKCLFGNPN